MDDDRGELITVLLVDDHQVFNESLARLLEEREGIEVVGTAITGAEAIEAAHELQPSVVLLDYDLPDRDGASVAAEIRRGRPETMVVMLTGSTDDDTLLAAIEAGCTGFLTKDRAAADVAAAVRGAAAGEALISPEQLARLLPKLRRSGGPVGLTLTPREQEILRHLAEGEVNKVIAANLHLSVHTVRNYVQSILNRLGAHSRLEAVSIAVREGLIEFPTSR